MAEIELLQTAGKELSFYLGPILFHKVMALVDSPRLLVWYESSVCLWCVCGLLKSSHSFLAAVIWRREMNPVCYWAFAHESLMHYVCENLRCSGSSSALDARQQYCWGTLHLNRYMLPFTTLALIFFFFSCHRISALGTLVRCHLHHAKLIATGRVSPGCNEAITV